MESAEAAEEKAACLSAAQRRAEIRRRKLLLNSEDRMNRIVGFAKNESEDSGTSRQLVRFYTAGKRNGRKLSKSFLVD